MRSGGREGGALFHFPRYSTLTKRVFCILAVGRGRGVLKKWTLFQQSRVQHGICCYFIHIQACKLKSRFGELISCFVASTPATRSLKLTASAAVEHKQEMRSLNINVSFQA